MAQKHNRRPWGPADFGNRLVAVSQPKRVRKTTGPRGPLPFCTFALDDATTHTTTPVGATENVLESCVVMVIKGT